MKRFLHVLFRFVLCLLAVLAGGILLYAAGYNSALYEQILSFALNQSQYVVIGAGLPLILAVLCLATFGRKKTGVDYVSFDTSDGMVSISRSAISEFVCKLGDEFAAVVSLEPGVTANKKQQLGLVLNLTVRTGTRVPELSKMLQERVKESLRDDLGFADVQHVYVKVQKIVGNPVVPVKNDIEK